MEIVGASGYQLGGIEVGRSTLQRLRGLMARPPNPLLLATSRVHGFWLHEPLNLVGITANGVVAEVARLRRRRLVHIHLAVWILEVPLGLALPPPGDRLAFVPEPGEPEFYARPTRPLFYPDWEPR